jgi:hypothetical protein
MKEEIRSGVLQLGAEACAVPLPCDSPYEYSVY